RRSTPMALPLDTTNKPAEIPASSRGVLQNCATIREIWGHRCGVSERPGVERAAFAQSADERTYLRKRCAIPGSRAQQVGNGVADPVEIAGIEATRRSGGGPEPDTAPPRWRRRVARQWIAVAGDAGGAEPLLGRVAGQPDPA